MYKIQIQIIVSPVKKNQNFYQKITAAIEYFCQNVIYYNIDRKSTTGEKI